MTQALLKKDQHEEKPMALKLKQEMKDIQSQIALIYLEEPKCSL